MKDHLTLNKLSSLGLLDQEVKGGLLFWPNHNLPETLQIAPQFVSLESLSEHSQEFPSGAKVNRGGPRTMRCFSVFLQSFCFANFLR